MNAIDTPTAPFTSYAKLLRDATNSTHDRLDQTIMAAKPFDNIENYGRFLRVQHGFHRDVSPLYSDPDLAAIFPDLAELSRFDAVTRDAADLGISLPAYDAPPATLGSGVPEALGWLYVVEGSNLGAAFLFKAAKKMGLSETHGAAHLAEGKIGRAAAWRNFGAALDAVPLSADEKARMISGARAAFDRVRALVADHM